jgi:hypothetical protein
MTTAREASGSGRAAFWLTLGALGWSVAVVVAAMVVPAYSGSGVTSTGATFTTSATLVGENGAGVLAVVTLPAVATLLVWGALHRYCSRGSAWARPAAWALIGLIGLLCLVGVMTIGIFLLPVAVLLGCAAARTPRASAPAST